MHLAEILRNCLRAAANRYPGCLVEINETVLDRTGLWEGNCTAEEALQRLESQRPRLLQAPAHLEIDNQSVIYLLDRSKELPAFHLYCGECQSERPRRHMLHDPRLVLDGVILNSGE